MASPKMFRTKIDLPPETREKMIALLNQQLADTSDLYSQTKQAHWNVKGTQFADLFTEVSRGLDKSLWFLQAHMQA